MPIQREQIENIVKSLDTGTLVDMLKVAGIHIDQEPSSGEQMIDAAQDGIEPWNQVKVDVPQTQRGPINDPATYMAQQPEAQQNPNARPEYLENKPQENWFTNGPIA